MSDAYAGEIGDFPASETARGRGTDEFDLASIGRAVRAHARPIIGLTLLALLGSFLFVNMVTPRYTGEAAILLENGENFYTRPGSERDVNNQAPPIDDQAVQSQVLLLNSRGLLVEAIHRLNLVGNPEFDPLAGPPQPWTRLLILAGLVQNPANLAPDDRVLDKFGDRLRVYPARGSRVINVEFTSADPQLAADGANMIANLYLKAQEGAKKTSARSAGDWLQGAIQPLRKKVDEAEAKVETFRAQNGLLMGANNITINTQQLADLNTQLANARAAQSDARSKAKLLREMIKQGRVLDISEVANNELIRRLSEQRATLSAQMALEGRTLLPQHPRMKELAAQLADLDTQIKLAAEKTVRGLENDARIAGSRVETMTAALEEQKKTSSAGNEKEIELRALERDAKAARDQLEAYMAKYREAAARDDDKAVPPDARVISRALVPSTPSFPKKIPIITIATLGTLVLAMAGVVAKELTFPGADRRPAPPLPSRGRSVFARRKVEPYPDHAPAPQEGHPHALGAAAAPASAELEEPRSEAIVDPDASATLDPVVEPVVPRSEAIVDPDPSATLDPVAPRSEAIVDPDASAMLDPTAEPVEPGGAVEPLSLGQEAGSADPIDMRVHEAAEVLDIAAHLLSLKPADRGIVVLVSRASDADHGPTFSLPLGRDMARSGRTILVDLDKSGRSSSRETGFAEAEGLGELMANRIGFAEAIHRDRHSSLHVVPAGAPHTQSEEPERGLSLVLQALARAYDAVLVDARPSDDMGALQALVAAVDVTLVVRGEADEAAMAAALERFAAEKPSLLLAVEPAANDDPAPPAFVAA